MNHASIIANESERLYRLRGYILNELNTRHFEALNEGDHTAGLNGYCLDALDEIPAGGMLSLYRLPAQAFAVRGLTMAEIQEQETLLDEMIAELLAEERAPAPEPIPESAAECEFGDEEYQWRLWQAGL